MPLTPYSPRILHPVFSYIFSVKGAIIAGRKRLRNCDLLGNSCGSGLEKNQPSLGGESISCKPESLEPARAFLKITKLLSACKPSQAEAQAKAQAQTQAPARPIRSERNAIDNH